MVYAEGNGHTIRLLYGQCGIAFEEYICKWRADKGFSYRENLGNCFGWEELFDTILQPRCHHLRRLLRELTMRYGKDYSKRYLAYFRKFYLSIDDIQILQTRLQNITWSLGFSN